MRLLLWNVGLGPRRGPTDLAIEELNRADWDVAVVLEVDAPGLERLRDGPWNCHDAGPPVAPTVLSMATLTRRGAEWIDRLEPPAFTCRDGKYLHRVMASSVRCDEADWTVVGAHMPNVWAGNGRKMVRRPEWKDECFMRLREWLAECEPHQGVVVAMDSNRGNWWRSTGEIHEHSKEAHTFVRYPERYGLDDAFRAADPDRVERPATYWLRGGGGEFIDRVFVSPDVIVETVELLLGREGLGELSDHLPVAVSLTR